MENLTSASRTDRLSNLSSFLRRLATSYKKSQLGHWMPLIFTTRVNIWERFLTGMKKRGSKKHFIAATTAKVLVTTFVFALLMTRGRRRRQKEENAKRQN